MRLTDEELGAIRERAQRRSVSGEWLGEEHPDIRALLAHADDLASALAAARQEAAGLRAALDDALDAWGWMVGRTRPTCSARVNEQIARARAAREPR